MKRNLSKVLTLFLAFAMVLGVMTMGASAAFKDEEQITYENAVDLLTGLGVINGYPDGSFAPKANFDRGGLAKMVAYYAWGGKDMSSYYAGAKVFEDLKGYDWAAGAINYGYNAGYINGLDAKTYNPSGTVKGSELAKTLLCLLGYKADAKDATYALTGANWELNSIRLAQTEGLFAGLAASFDPTAALTREEAAQMFYNLLGKNVATKYDDNKAPIEFSTSVSTFIKYFGMYWDETGSSPDDFGRPAMKYTNKQDNSKYFTVQSSPVKTYTTAVTGGQVYTDLGKPAAGFTFTSIVNGETKGDLASKVVSGNMNRFGGNGTLIEIYKDTKGNYTAVAVQTFAGIINSHSAAVKDANGDVIAGKEENVTVTAAGKTGTFKTSAFSDADATANTRVLVTASTTDGINYTIQSVKAATSKTLTATWRNDASFIAEGQTYQYSENNNAPISAAEVTDKTAKVVYFDDYGYVIYVDDPSAALPNYAYVLAAAQEEVLFSGMTFYAKLLYTDGTVETVKTAGLATEGMLVSYKSGTGTDAGKLVLTHVSSAVASSSYKITKNNASFVDGFLNNKTVFVVETTAADGTKVYNTYTGISSVPSLTCTKYNGVKSGNVWTIVYAMDSTLADASVVSTDVVYVYGDSAKTSTDVTKGTYVTYTAIVNGTITTIDATSAAGLDGYYIALKKDTKGLAESGTPMTKAGTVDVLAVTGTEAAADGIIKLGSDYCVYDANTAVYVANADGSITVSSVAAIKKDGNDTVKGYTTNGVLTAIVITTVA